MIAEICCCTTIQQTMTVFRSLKSRNFKLFFYGQSISLIGTWMQKTAVSWLVYQICEPDPFTGFISLRRQFGRQA
jgi:hypothetical protein